MEYISSLILPLIVLLVIFYAIIKKVDIYDSFIEGVKESFPMILTLFPTYLAIFFGVNIFIKSGVLDFIISLLKPIIKIFKLPNEVIMLSLLRPISGSSSLSILNTIFSKYGVDSFIGKMSSIIQGSTDTTFYILTLYLSSIGIKKIRYTLLVCLLADLTGIILSVILSNIFF